MPRKFTPRVCQYCGEAFTVATKRVTAGGGKYCTPACASAATKKTHRTCLQCEALLPVSAFDRRTRPDGRMNGYARKCRRCVASNQLGSAESRFWSHVDQSGGPDACWPWTAGQDGTGYGSFRTGPAKVERAHRFAWILTNGPIPDGLFVCHECDTPLCCNPSHHFLGTSADNNRDRHAKGRSVIPVGERHGMAKLTEDDVRVIRRLHNDGHAIKDLASMFDVSKSTVYFVVRRWHWRHVA